MMRVSFAELKHTNHGNNAIPYGVSIIAACVIEKFGDKIDAKIFKSVPDFTKYLEDEIPKVACFSNYLWNFNLCYQFAKRIKRLSPDTVIIFGGPNYTDDFDGQRRFLLNHPEIDFYVYRDGEIAIVELFNKLLEHDNIKNGEPIVGCHYIFDGNVIRGNNVSLQNLDVIPSPYLTGLCDSFLSGDFIPLIQTTRGCPFSCTYCQQGNSYFNHISRFSANRIMNEVEYIARHTSVPDLMLADTNFGMYKEDITICNIIADIQKKYNYPKYFHGIEGKNNKDRVTEAASIVKGAYLSAAVQSTDINVLDKVKRRNVSIEQMIQVGKHSEELGFSSFSEVILCLPGDTKESHFKSVLDLVDVGIDIVRSHQLIMLPSAEISSKESRDKYNMQTVFRVTPGTTNRYCLFGEVFIAPEIDEICVANSTMTFDDYLECRFFDLTIEIFYNDNITSDVIRLLKNNGVSITLFIMELYYHVRYKPNKLTNIYDNFLRETKEVWKDKEELKKFLVQDSVIDKYIAGEFGNNEQLFYRDISISKHMDSIQEIALNVAKELISGI
jgi:radical SAM superfamily enzyme YgiQ (UPF0313 family)